MIVRALDANGDWEFGKGRNSYRTNLLAVAQSIQTRVLSFLGDCIFALNDGIDWFNLLGFKNQEAIRLAVNTTILNTENVTGILQLSVELLPTRELVIVYQVQTSYSTSVSGEFTYNFGTGAN